VPHVGRITEIFICQSSSFTPDWDKLLSRGGMKHLGRLRRREGRAACTMCLPVRNKVQAGGDVGITFCIKAKKTKEKIGANTLRV
jgi:hypothetical protein